MKFEVIWFFLLVSMEASGANKKWSDEREKILSIFVKVNREMRLLKENQKSQEEEMKLSLVKKDEEIKKLKVTNEEKVSELRYDLKVMRLFKKFFL